MIDWRPFIVPDDMIRCGRHGSDYCVTVGIYKGWEAQTDMAGQRDLSSSGDASLNGTFTQLRLWIFTLTQRCGANRKFYESETTCQKNSTTMTRRNQPWASGPAEILQHGINLLKTDTDANRRLAMLSIDNAVELMVKTYLGLPKRVTGLRISRADLAEINESFPRLLDALEQHASDKLDGIDLGEIDWYHRLRNELYHQGNGLNS
jgi:hypothetical protein